MTTIRTVEVRLELGGTLSRMRQASPMPDVSMFVARNHLFVGNEMCILDRVLIQGVSGGIGCRFLGNTDFRRHFFHPTKKFRDFR